MSIASTITAEIRKLFPEEIQRREQAARQAEQAERQGCIDRIAAAEAELTKQLPALEKSVADAKQKRDAAVKKLKESEEALRAAMGAEWTARSRFDRIRSIETGELWRGAPERIEDEQDRLQRLLRHIGRVPRDILKEETTYNMAGHGRKIITYDHAKRDDELARIKTAREALQALKEAAPADWDEAINSVLEPVAGMLRKAGV